MKIFRRRADYTLFDNKMNKEILEEIKVEPADQKRRRRKSDWLRHVTRINRNRITQN